MRVRNLNALYISILFVLSFFVFNFGINIVGADNPGVIDTSNDDNQAKVCHNVSCSSFGIINFELGSEPSIIIDSNNGISGNVWGNELGWINFNPTGAGVTIANNTGELEGYAWSQVSGWINFSPTGEGVTIDPDTGRFEGYAWSGGAYGGWIKFDCSDDSTCVKTTWRPVTSGCSGKGCGGPPSCNYPFTLIDGECVCEPPLIELDGWCAYDDSFPDVCPNIDYIQVEVPFGYQLIGGNCVLSSLDICPNIAGIQTSVPNGKHLDKNGQCVNNDNPPNDTCPNIDGVQTSVPNGKHLDHGQCVDDVVDVCPNVDGFQTSVPDGQHIVGGQCVDMLNPDFCPNIGGDQETVPNGMHIERGDCVNDLDACSNLSGMQISIPVGKHLDNSGRCVDDIIAPPPHGDDGNLIPDVFIGIQTGFLDFIDKLSNVIKSPEGNIISKIVAIIGFLSGFFALFSLADIGLNLLRLWSLFLYGMGFKKRNRPWGVVYDSVTKQPLDPAYVVLYDMQGNEVGSSITDLDGRYGFLVSPGFYRIVASKTNYTYPSVKLAGRTSDELYNDLYFGENIEIKTEGEVITKNIPLDQINFDWNEFAKKEQKRMKFYHRRDVLLARFSDLMFSIGFLVSIVILLIAPKPFNVIIFCLYLVLLLIRRTTIQRSKKGRVFYSADSTPISYGIIRVKSMESGQEVAHRVLDKTGNYYCIIPNGIYNISVEKKNDDGSYAKIYNSDNFEVKKGILKKDFKI